MELLRKIEENEKIQLDAQKIRNFQKEINNTYDKNLDDCLDKCLIEFIDKYEPQESDITRKLRMLIEYIKNNNNIK